MTRPSTAPSRPADPKKVLVIYSVANTTVATTMEYVRSFGKHSRNDVSYINGTHGARLGVELDAFDAVWLNYCCRLCFPDNVSPEVQDALERYRGLKLMSVQDEYDRTETLRQGIQRLGFDVVITCVPQRTLSHVYPPARFPRTEFITALTGYVPEYLEGKSGTTPLERRPIVIGYRGRDIGARYGELGFWKSEIGRRMKAICLDRRIQCDIEVTEESRIYGDSWYSFVEACRTMLGSESGSNVFDFDGSLERQYKALKREKPDLSYEEFRPYLENHEVDIGMGQISPRVFEAAALHTPMILLTGRYSGLIQPGEHYIELRKDFANVDDVLRQVQDLPALEAMADRAYEHLIASGSYSYRRFIELVDGVIARKLADRAKSPDVERRPRPVKEASVRASHREGLAFTDLPTPYPLDSSHYFGRELDRLVRLNVVDLRTVTTRGLTDELARRLLARMFGRGRGWIAARLQRDPGTLAKARVSTKVIGTRPLRTLFVQWLADRRIRRRVGCERLVADLVKLEILRQACRGILQTPERFFLERTLDETAGVLTVTSLPDRCPPGEDRGKLVRDLSESLGRGTVRCLVWDHSALGSHIIWEVEPSQRVTVAVGETGVHRFEALAEIARYRPDRVRDVLRGIFGGGS